jgi:hypothetical protein
VKASCGRRILETKFFELYWSCLQLRMILSVFVRFQVLTAASLNITAFWDIAPCSFVEVVKRFRGEYGVRRQGDE